MKKKYDIIYSLGYNCGCGLFLRDNSLRVVAGPFDWVGNATFEQRFDCLLNGFTDFMNIKYFRFLPKKPGDTDIKCDYYENTKTHFYFIHDFPIGCDFEKQFSIVREKYERRIKRFYENIKTKKRILLIWLSLEHNTPDNVVKDLCTKFCKKMNRDDIDFVIIEHAENEKEFIERKIAPNISRYNFHVRGDYVVRGNAPLLTKFYRQYQIARPYWKGISHSIKLAISKIICPLLFFNKDWKIKLKVKLRRI